MLESAGDLDQDPVSGGVSMKIVDLLEPVEVHERHTNRATIASLPGESALEPIHEELSAGQSAEIVVQGLAEEHFMINTHPWVLEKFAVKGRDYDEYIAMMREGRAAEVARAAAAA